MAPSVRGLNWYWSRYVRLMFGYELAFVRCGTEETGNLQIFQGRAARAVSAGLRADRLSPDRHGAARSCLLLGARFDRDRHRLGVVMSTRSPTLTLSRRLVS